MLFYEKQILYGTLSEELWCLEHFRDLIYFNVSKSGGRLVGTKEQS